MTTESGSKTGLITATLDVFVREKPKGHNATQHVKAIMIVLLSICELSISIATLQHVVRTIRCHDRSCPTFSHNTAEVSLSGGVHLGLGWEMCNMGRRDPKGAKLEKLVSTHPLPTLTSVRSKTGGKKSMLVTAAICSDHHRLICRSPVE